MPVGGLIAGGIGAVGSIGSALIGSSASKDASNAQVQAQQQALAQQQSLYSQGLGTQSGYVNQAQSTLSPFIAAGKGAAQNLTNLLTPGSSAAYLAQNPGFQFQSQYGTMAATNALSARSGASAGPLATAISQYNNGLAGTNYFNTVGAMQNLTNTGANAANALSGIFGSAGNAALGGGIQAGNAQANTLGNIGNANASGILGSANAISGGINGATGGISNALLYNALGQNGGANGLYTPQQIANIGNMNAGSVTDAQSNAYGIANGLVP